MTIFIYYTVKSLLLSPSEVGVPLGRTVVVLGLSHEAVVVERLEGVGGAEAGRVGRVRKLRHERRRQPLGRQRSPVPACTLQPAARILLPPARCALAVSMGAVGPVPCTLAVGMGAVGRTEESMGAEVVGTYVYMYVYVYVHVVPVHVVPVHVVHVHVHVHVYVGAQVVGTRGEAAEAMERLEREETAHLLGN